MKDAKESRTIFIILTTQCNLRCTYCYEANKAHEKIDEERAFECVCEDIDRTKDLFNDYTVVFHGGEPFLEFETMRHIAERLYARYPDTALVCNATTNGTVLNDEIREWLRANKHRFVCTLSLDGGRETHNRSRCNSYDKIDREFFRSTWPYQPVKMTVSPETLGMMYDNIIALYDEGFEVNPSLACEVDWDLERDIPILERELSKLIEFYLAHPEKTPGKLIDISPEVFSPYNVQPHNRACGAGTNIITFDVYGHRYPCHAFISDFNKGKSYDREAIEGLFTDLKTKNGLELSPGCEGCYAYAACSPCYGLNYTNRHAMARFDERICGLVKTRIAAAASFYAQMLLNKTVDYIPLRGKSDNDKANIIAGILYLQEAQKRG